MIQGDLGSGDYWLDVPISTDRLRSLVGFLISACAAAAVTAIRLGYQTYVTRKLTKRKSINLYQVSPPRTVDEAFLSRRVFFRAVKNGELTFALVFLACTLGAAISAGQTALAEVAVRAHNITRHEFIWGYLATANHQTLTDSYLPEIKFQVEALDKANVPLHMLLDFLPDNPDGYWIYWSDQWNNNSWTGNCSYNHNSAVKLEIVTGDGQTFHEHIPALGQFLPAWATLNDSASRQQQAWQLYGSSETGESNDTELWHDALETWVFGTFPSEGSDNDTSFSIAFANYLVHNATGSEDNILDNTPFSSDVYTAVCDMTLNSSSDGYYRAWGTSGGYQDIIDNVAGVYGRLILDASSAGEVVKQPEGSDMVRNWQAFNAIKDTGPGALPVQRTVLVNRMRTQIRLSAIIVIGSIFVASGIVILFTLWIRRRAGPLLRVPTTQLAWQVQAARERARALGQQLVEDFEGPSQFTKEHSDLNFALESAEGGFWISDRDQHKGQSSGSPSDTPMKGEGSGYFETMLSVLES